MSHDALKNLLTLCLDGAATPAEVARVESHLAACAECRSVRDGWARWRPVLAAAARPADASFSNRVMARVRAEPAPRSGPVVRIFSRIGGLFRPQWMWPLGAAAAALAVMVLAPVRRPAPVSLDTAQFVAELLPAVDETDGGTDDVASDIETYFL
jgi:anti-sigma factor RsiW